MCDKGMSGNVGAELWAQLKCFGIVDLRKKQWMQLLESQPTINKTSLSIALNVD